MDVFRIERDIRAPIERVWKAWTTAEDLEQWYSPGPESWTVDELDVKPGGGFRMHMQTPDGEHVSQGRFHLVDAPNRLRQGPTDGSMIIETVLESKGEGTHMTVMMEGLPEEQQQVMQGAWSAGFDKLERLLAPRGPD